MLKTHRTCIVGLHEFRPKEFSAQLFGPVRNSGNFSARAQSHIKKIKLACLRFKLPPDFRTRFHYYLNFWSQEMY